MSDVDQPLDYLLDWQAAELAAVEHMKTLGFIDAQTTKSGADGGIDVESSEAAAQVKFYATPVGRPDIQRLRGAAHEYRLAVFYSTGGYSREAVQYADQAGIALYRMDPFGNAEAVSRVATVLLDSAQVEERRARLDEVKATRYRLALLSFERDLSLYAQFIRQAPLESNEAALYAHVASALDHAVREFATAVEARKFEVADEAFEEINKRIGFLAWITGSELRDSYADLEDATSEGWSLDTSGESDFLLQRIAFGAFKLRDLALEFLKDWDELLPPGTTNDLADEELRRAAGMLATVSFNQSILSPELLHHLRETVRNGVQRLRTTATASFQILFDKHMQLDLARPRGLVDGKLRVDALAEGILRQLDSPTQ